MKVIMLIDSLDGEENTVCINPEYISSICFPSNENPNIKMSNGDEFAIKDVYTIAAIVDLLEVINE